MTIRFRLTASYALLLVFLLAIVVLAGSRFSTFAQTTRDMVEGDVARAELANAINLHAESAAGRLLLLFILKERDDRVTAYKEIDLHNAGIDHALEKMGPLMSGSDRQRALERLLSLRKTFEGHFTATVEDLETGEEARAVKRMTGDTSKSLAALLAETSAMAKQQQQSLAARQMETLEAVQQSMYWVLILGLGALVAGAILSIRITQGVVTPLAQAVTTADGIADGNLVKEVPAGGKDELGALLQRMGHMRNSLRHVIGTILGNAQQVSQAAANLASPVSDVKAGSAEQSTLADAIDQSIAQLSNGINDMAVNVQAARDEAVKARDMAQEGAQAIVVVVDEITKIAHSVSESAQSVGRLDQSARAVADTVLVIREIAEQTNLLALNASIEAARAGESGRGFAVVADEVRKLANRTADATGEIDRVITGINEQTRDASTNIEAGKSGMERGTELIRGIVAPLESLRNGAQSSLENLENLTRLAGEQATAGNSIASNVRDIVGMAHRNQSAIASVATITGQLAATADQLQKSVSTFRL